MSKVRIYFYGPAPLKYSYELGGDGLAEGSRASPDCLFFNTASLYLDAYIRQVDPVFHSEIEWSHIQLLFKNVDEIADDLNKYNANVLCVSLYIWNNEQTLSMISEVKQKLGRDLLVIAGGPSVGIVRNPNYLNENPNIDYAIFAQGEKPFYDILKHEFDNTKLSVLSTKNCAWLGTDGKVKKSDHEFYKQSSGSPYIESEHIIKSVVRHETYLTYKFEFPWETSKGCPYNCSFCDWTSGLSNKVSKRRAIYEDELELFAKYGVFRFYMSDANFGLHKEDEEIVDTLVRLKVEKDYPFKFFSINFSKVKKDVVYRLANKLLQHDMLDYFKCSIQDMHKHILDNIDRPDVPWEEQITYLKDMMVQNPNKKPSIEVIQGLPGQTRETWENMLYEMSSHGFTMNIYKFMMIPNSPAGYDTEWFNKMGLKTDRLYLDDEHSDEYVVETYSFDRSDYSYFNLTTEFYARMHPLGTPIFDDTSVYKKVVEFAKMQPEFDSVIKSMTEYVLRAKESALIASHFYNIILPRFLEVNKLSGGDYLRFLRSLHKPALVETIYENNIHDLFLTETV